MSKITRFTKNIAALSLLVLVSQVNAGTLRPVNVNTENGVYTGWGKHPSKQTSINNAQAKAKQAVLKLAKETCKKVGGKLESYQITYKKNYGYYADPVGPAKANWHHQYEAYLLGVCKTS